MSFKLHFARVAVLISVLSAGLLSYAVTPDYFFDADVFLKKGSTVYIVAYDPRLGGVYEVQSSHDKRQKNHYTRLGDLSIAISKIKKNRIKRRPKRLIGKVFRLDQFPLKTYKAPRHIK